MLFAKDMSIIWSDDSSYWQWISVKETSDVTVDAAELLDVCWLEIRARIDTTKLSPGIPYEAAFVAMMKDHSYGWENPVKLGLLLPNGSKKEHQRDLREIKQRNQWTEIPVGEFITFVLRKEGSWKSLCVEARVCIGRKDLSSKVLSFAQRIIKLNQQIICHIHADHCVSRLQSI
ncbi:Protein PHLOEM PROTEIN 2-LIKE like [Melia azedarach]|uniref:Protein PHLOEM PROTEIN 2-LIKE like n=1 Tax=Melia azedarach TaxID=155640 RepID=A0ACC1WU06_MELAZ|nr:Protein PHLOEM PROTEIN 2-LIKE like [Melia azedarach]